MGSSLATDQLVYEPDYIHLYLLYFKPSKFPLKKRLHVSICVCVRECGVCMWVCACVCACVRVRVRVCVWFDSNAQMI